MTLDYRDSHTGQGKGEHYEKSFFKNNYKNYIYQWEKEVIEKIYQQMKPKNYLDFACGTGRITRLAKGNAEKITGIDVSESMLSVAREQVKSGKFILQDITADDFQSDVKYDFVSSFRFFTNAQDALRKEVMQSLLDLMAPDSYFLFNLHMNSTSSFALAARLYEKMFGKRKGFNHLNLKHMQENLLLGDNFDVVSIHSKGIVPIIREEQVRSKLAFSAINAVEATGSILPFYNYFSKYQIVLCKRK